MYVTDVWELELDALVCMGQALCALGRHKEAEEEARRALTACERHLHPDHHPRMGEFRALLALIAPA